MQACETLNGIFNFIKMTKKEHWLTQELVKEYFEYCDKSGRLYRKKNTYRRKNIGHMAGTINSEGYYVMSFKDVIFMGHRIIFLLHHGYLPIVVDHIDRDPSNCRISNLRAATLSNNSQNKNSKYKSSSKYLGVSKHFHQSGFRWYSAIIVNGKKHHLGSFKDEALAALVYNKHAIFYHGEHANINIIKKE